MGKLDGKVAFITGAAVGRDAAMRSDWLKRERTSSRSIFVVSSSRSAIQWRTLPISSRPCDESKNTVVA